MREIKFRGWHGDAGDMVFFGLGQDNIPCMSEDGEIYTFCLEDGHPVMQFTGLLDRHGVEIYEGDIVRVDWRDSRYGPMVGIIAWGEDDAAWCIGAGVVSEVHWSHEVIGNIHQNPEMLESE